MQVYLTPEIEKIVKSELEFRSSENADEFVKEAIINYHKMKKLNRELKIGIEQANRNEFSDYTIDDIIKEEFPD